MCKKTLAFTLDNYASLYIWIADPTMNVARQNFYASKYITL